VLPLRTNRTGPTRAHHVGHAPPRVAARSGWHHGDVTITSVDHVQLAMPPGQEARARDFYAGLLGLRAVAKPAHLEKRGGCWFESGTARVHLGVAQDFRPARKAHVALLVGGLAELSERLRGAGVEVRSEEPLEGCDRVYIDDVFGNRLELMEKSAEAAPFPGPVWVRSAAPEDGPWLAEVIVGSWGATSVVSRGRRHEADQLPALVAESGGERVGLLTYCIENGQLEVVSVDALLRRRGVGGALLAAAEEVAMAEGCRRLWLITTNDNLDALRFYQRRGLRLVAVHVGAVDRAREIKPQIPTVGSFGIGVHDELELAMDLR
jgi:ribosomal protein S18 acetylase RimI-like enzyme